MRPNDDNYLRKVFFAAMLVTFFGTILETIVVFFFWGSSWERWTLGFKIATPMLHVVFSAAQLWGAYNFYNMWQGRVKALRSKDVNLEMGHGLDQVGSLHSDRTDARVEVRPGREA
jgi:hypothetical protein